MTAIDLDAFALIHAAGAVQGFFLALTLALRRRNTFANRLLGLWIFVFSCDLLGVFLYEKGYLTQVPHLIASTYSFPFLYGPLLYLYTRALTGAQTRLAPRQWLHLLPFGLHHLSMWPFYLQDGAAKAAYLRAFEESARSVDMELVSGLKIAHGLVYFILAFFALGKYQEAIRDSFSALERINLNWLRVLVRFQGGLMGIILALFLARLGGVDLGPTIDPIVYLGVTLLIYLVGYFGLRQPEIFAAAQTATGEAKEKYARTRLNEDRAQQYLQTLVDHMEREKPFRRSSLTLQELAAELSMGAHHLSQLINDRLQQNFFDFVNSYRVKEVQRRLHNADDQHLTILAIAYEAGFNSKSAFNNIFKKQTRMTPSQFKRQA
ncbi:MAG: helix-turn-helix domain-containing protein [Candidatus Latescibacteria bacterium]|nr:helix-turn-helix domain-containing protein [Candidatus Latescibacterota bacterium]